MELAFKLDEAVDGTEMAAVCLAVEGGEHARVVAERSHTRAKTASEGLAAGNPAEVVVTPRTGRLRDELQLARAGAERKHGLHSQIALEDELSAVGTAGLEAIERDPEPYEILFPHGWDDVDPVGEFIAPLDDATETSYHDVGDSLPVERLQQSDRVEGVVGH